jgi:hypothetical protein
LLNTNAKDLKNGRPTFCRITKAILKDQICRNVFTYINDIVVASKKKSNQIKDLAKSFTNMRGAQLKVNLEKCVFSMQSGKVLGCLVSVKGIEVNLNKIKAIMHMKPLQLKKRFRN